MYELTDPPNPPGSTGHISCCSQPPIINQVSLNSALNQMVCVDSWPMLPFIKQMLWISTAIFGVALMTTSAVIFFMVKGQGKLKSA
ncbi:uncharacterized [Tachysurus ichikawai]